jgi:hypothetical protein
MALHPLVIGHTRGTTEPQNNWIQDHHDQVQFVEGDDLQSVLVKAMFLAEREFNTGWFWFLDDRYTIIVPHGDLPSKVSPTTPHVFAVMPSSLMESPSTFYGDPFAHHGGLYYLPTLGTLDKQNFEFYSLLQQKIMQKPLNLESNIGQWPHRLVDNVATMKRCTLSAFSLHSDEPQLDPLPSYIQTVQAVGSIYESHAHLAGLSETQNFWVLDGDFKFNGSHSFLMENFWPDELDYVHVWYVKNPINGLVYGHGGPKLFNKHHFARPPVSAGVDVTLSVGRELKVHEECVGTHAFNWSAFSTWRTAVREAAKLSKSDDPDAKERLLAWTTKADFNADFASYCLAGAKTGVFLANQTVNEGWINNYPYLRQLFEKEFPND